MGRILVLLVTAIAIAASYFAAVAINPSSATEGIAAFASIALPGIVAGLLLAVRAIWNLRGQSMRRRRQSAGLIDFVEARRRFVERAEGTEPRPRDSDAA